MGKASSRIRECREACGMTVDDLAKILGKNRATVYRYDNGQIENIPIQVVSILAATFDVDPMYLIGLSDEKGSFNREQPVTQLDDEHKELIDRYDALGQRQKKRLLNFLTILESETGR